MKTITTPQIISNAKNTKMISEKDILLIKHRSNRERKDLWEYDEETEEILLTPEQTEKGYKFLYNLAYTPIGKVRKNCPFGYRELDTLEGENKGFTFDGFYNATSKYGCDYIPLYTFFSSNGSFQYYYLGGEIHIVG